VSTDDAAAAGNGDFGTSPFFWRGSQASHNLLVITIVGVSDAKAQEQIEKLGADLFTCHLGPFPRRALPRASFAKLPYMSANGRALAEARNLKPHGSSYGVGEQRFKAFGERPRQVPTAGWSILYRLKSADGCTLALIEPSSRADRAFNPTYRPEHIWVSATSHRNTSGERKPHGIT
jgi:hypothetical protein